MEHDFEHEQEEYQPAPRPRGNTVGLVGFILSLVGIVTCGALGLPGLICSAIGLKREPRGLAIAGTIIGGLGTLLFAGLLVGVVSGGGLFTGAVKTGITLTEVVMEVENYRQDHDGELPSQEEGDRIVSRYKDGWDNPIRFERTESGYVIRSAGPDGEWQTPDDMSQAK